MAVTLGRAELDTAKELLQALRNSCYEGLDGTWDCSTDDGKEGFDDMALICHKIAEILKIQLDDYEAKQDEDEEEEEDEEDEE